MKKEEEKKEPYASSVAVQQAFPLFVAALYSLQYERGSLLGNGFAPEKSAHTEAINQSILWENRNLKRTLVCRHDC